MPEKDSEKDKDRPRQAILILHGIGRQQRFETLDRFSNGLRGVIGCETVRPLELPQSSPFNNCVRLTCKSSLDVFEFYWAPYTSDKTSIAAMVRWIFQAGFSPIRRLAYNLGLVSLRARQEAQARSGRSPLELPEHPGVAWRRYYFKSFGHFLRELWRLVYVLALSVALAAGAVTLIGRTEDLWERLQAVYGGIDSLLFGGFQDIVTVAIFVIAVTIGVALVWSLPTQRKDLWQLLRNWLKARTAAWSDIREKLDELQQERVDALAKAGKDPVTGFLANRWHQVRRLGTGLMLRLADDLRHEFVARAMFLLASLLLLAGLALLIWVLVDGDAECQMLPGLDQMACLSTAVREAGAVLWTQERAAVGVTMMLLLLAVVLKKVVLDYLADIALYTTSDERSAFARTREEILDDVGKRLQWLLGPDGYERVALAGHSLGSVIAYDAINQLIIAKRRNGKDGPELDRLRTFITFGSPLNKVLYFFRAKVESHETIRAHILGRLYGFRRPRSLLTVDPQIRATSDATLLETDERQLPELHWLNVSAALDPISAPLAFYDTDEEVRRWHWRYWVFGLCHMRYWRDPKFYACVVDALRHGDEAQSVASCDSEIFHQPGCPVAQRIKQKNRVRGSEARVGRRPHRGCAAAAAPG